MLWVKQIWSQSEIGKILFNQWYVQGSGELGEVFDSILHGSPLCHALPLGPSLPTWQLLLEKEAYKVEQLEKVQLPLITFFFAGHLCSGALSRNRSQKRLILLHVRTIKRPLCQITLISSCLPRHSRPHQIRMDLMLHRLMTLPWEEKTEKIQLCLSLLTGRALEGP